MRIIDAYYVACDRAKHSIVFYKRLALFLSFFASGTTLEARDWTVYVYIQTADRYQEGLATVQQIEHSLKDDFQGRIAVTVDVCSDSRADRFIIERGKRTNIPLNPHRNGSHVELLKEGVSKAFSQVTEGKTMLIVSGHGTGILTPSYDLKEKKWFYEPDEGCSEAPCKQYCSARYEQFCNQVQHVMEGKSLITSQGGTSCLSTQEIQELVRSTHTLLGRKLDILGCDSCYMAMLEIGYEVKDYVRYIVASQDCEDKEGWSYDNVMKALESLSAAQVGRRLVYSYERTQLSRGFDRFSLSVHDLAYSEQLAQALDVLVQKMMLHRTLLGSLCRARTMLHSVTGLPFYVDLKEFLETFYAELSDSQITPDIEGLGGDILYTLEVLNLMVRASVAGPSSCYLKGCSLYFPLGHIDSSYQGSFMQKHLWESFLKYFTTGCLA